jgi:hypothetical protein
LDPLKLSWAITKPCCKSATPLVVAVASLVLGQSVKLWPIE